MKRAWWLLLAVLPLLGGCGTIAQETLNPVNRGVAAGPAKRLVVMPFADHTPGDSPLGYWRRNVLIMEALQDEILRHGHRTALQEDVIAYLASHNIIKEAGADRPVSGATRMLESELEKEWSDQMKQQIRKVLYRQQAEQERLNGGGEGKYWNNRRMLALDYKTLTSLGANFAADYIVRGRIIVFQAGQEDSFNPVQTGILPFFFKVGNRGLFGVAQSETYEMIDQMAFGGAFGAAVAASNWPAKGSVTSSVVGHPRLGGGVVTATDSAAGLNAAIWGAAGVGLAHLAHKGGRVDNAVVQLRMVIQDARSGEIVWTNRAEVKVTPESIFGQRDEQVLVARAIQGVAASLIDDFIANEHREKVVKIDADGAISTSPAQEAGGALGVRRAVDAHAVMRAGQGEEAAGRALEELVAISRRQGSGEITIFFPLGSAVLAEEERDRLVRFADVLAREARGRKLMLVSVGSASTLGEADYNQRLARQRALVPEEILKKHLVNTPHEFHQIYGVGDIYSPRNVTLDEHKRYQHVRIVAVFGPDQLPINLHSAHR